MTAPLLVSTTEIVLSAVSEHDNKMANFSPDDGGSLVQVSSGTNSWKGRSLISPDRNDFAPRVGFAYQQTSRIVVRGGFAIFYQHHYRYGSESMLSFNPPYLVDTTLSQNQGSTTPVFYLSKGFPISTLNSALRYTDSRSRSHTTYWIC